MQTTSFKVSDSLYLVRHVLVKGAPAKPAELPVNHIAVIDCSGSMYGELPQIREQLKKKLPKLLKEKDTISIIWFSGKGQYGTLLEAEPVATLADLKEVNAAIDRWLKPVCLTGFKEPIEEASKLIEKIGKKRPGSTFSLFFMSDGCDNQWSRQEILKAVEKTAGKATSTYVEYGYYADRPLLTAMAQQAGGTLIFSENFDKWAPIFEASMQKSLSGAPRVEVQIKGDPVGGFAMALVGGDLISFEASGGKASVPEDLPFIVYLSTSPVGTKGRDLVAISKDGSDSGKTGSDLEALDAAYAAVSLFSVRMKPDVVYPMLKALGDIQFIEQFSGCFGKQKYSEFMGAAQSAAFSPKARFAKGWDPNKVPRDDATTVLDVLRLLADDENNRVLLDHPSFKYSRISRARVDSSTVLTADEQEQVRLLTEEMTKSAKNAKKVAELSAKIASISNKPAPLEFVADPAPDGYSISNLVYNEEFPNISIQVKRTGHVNVSSRLPETLKGKVPEQFPTFIYRNYAIVKDGLVNVETLPVALSADTLAKLFALHRQGLVGDDVIQAHDGIVLINFRSLPIINRQMVKEVSAQTLFEQEWDLLKVQGQQKVYNSTLKDLVGTKKSEGFEVLYGKEAADWLKEQGFTDYSGFGPKQVQADARDFYMAKQLAVGIKSFSSLPSLAEYNKQVAKGKLTPSAALLEPAVKAIEAYKGSDEYKKASDQNKVLEAWLKGEQKKLDRERRQKITSKAQQVFGIIVGQVWFKEFKSLDENTLSLTLDSQKLDCKVEMKEVKIDL
jgi:hypothetical protein